MSELITRYSLIIAANSIRNSFADLLSLDLICYVCREERVGAGFLDPVRYTCYKGP